MKKAFNIARRELYSYFSTWMGYIILAIALLIEGILFNAFAIGDAPKFSADVLRDFFYFSSGVGMVAAVLFAMRLIAEEKQAGTLVLYYTSPVSEREIIYGKFLSVIFIFILMQVGSLYLPGLILIEGKVSLGHLFAGYLGVSLLGASVLSLSLFASTLASNQLISGVLGAFFTVFFLVMWLVAYRVDAPFRDVFVYMSIHNERFKPFSLGVLHTRDIVYYLSFTVFFLEASVKVLETRRLQG